MIRLSDVVSALRDADIDRVVYGAASDIDTVAAVLRIDPHYLSVQVRIHLPFFDRGELVDGNSIQVIRTILTRLRSSLDDFGAEQASHRRLNGIDELLSPAIVKQTGGELFVVSANGARQSDLFVGRVETDMGLRIQTKMHYIHSPRTDTELHAGLFLNGYGAPIAYAAVSELDREYLLRATKLSGIVPESDAGRVAVMTRAYGYNPLPKNAMSKLFDFVSKQMSAAGYRYVVTALNPLLGFKGSIFSGSSFVPFATSPMRYWYNEDGSYMNRRKEITSIPQKFSTPPIVWLARGLDSRRQRRLEQFDGPIYQISQAEYDAR